jgi:hypothetical protein
MVGKFESLFLIGMMQPELPSYMTFKARVSAKDLDTVNDLIADSINPNRQNPWERFIDWAGASFGDVRLPMFLRALSTTDLEDTLEIFNTMLKSVHGTAATAAEHCSMCAVTRIYHGGGEEWIVTLTFYETLFVSGQHGMAGNREGYGIISFEEPFEANSCLPKLRHAYVHLASSSVVMGQYW